MGHQNKYTYIQLPSNHMEKFLTGRVKSIVFNYCEKLSQEISFFAGNVCCYYLTTFYIISSNKQTAIHFILQQQIAVATNQEMYSILSVFQFFFIFMVVLVQTSACSASVECFCLELYSFFITVLYMKNNLIITKIMNISI